MACGSYSNVSLPDSDEEVPIMPRTYCPALCFLDRDTAGRRDTAGVVKLHPVLSRLASSTCPPFVCPLPAPQRLWPMPSRP
jgi:hypothetical protein